MRIKLTELWRRYSSVFFEILFLLMVSSIPLLWFREGHIVVGLDSGYPIDYVRYFFQRMYTWLGSQNFGIDMTFDIGSIPYNALPALIQMIGVPYYNVQKTLFVGWFGAIVFSIYYLLAYLYPNKNQWISRLSGTVVYAFSFHLYTFWLQGEQYILSSYMLFPLFTIILLKFVRQESAAFRTALLMNCALFFFGSGGVHGIVFLGPALVVGCLLFLYFLLLEDRTKRLTYVIRFAVFGSMFLGIYVFLNAYFLLPYFSTAIHFNKQVASAGGFDGIVGWTNVISTFTSFANLFRLQGDNNWYSSSNVWFYAFLIHPVLIAYSFVFPVFAFLAPVFIKAKKEQTVIIFFIFLALCGIFLSAGTHPPLGFLYALMLKYIPGFVIFRSAYYKFVPLIYLSYAVLIGSTAYYLLSFVQSRRRVFVGLIFVGSLLLYHYPYFQNTHFESNKPFTTMIKVPQYVYDFGEFINSTPIEYRTLVVPPAANEYNFIAYTWGYWGLYPIFPGLTDRGVVQNDSFIYNEYENALIRSLYRNLRMGDFETFLTAAKLAHVRYILVTSDLAKDFEISLSEDPNIYRQLLQKSQHFSSVWQKGPWEVYEIRDVLSSKITAHTGITLNTHDLTSVPGMLYEKFTPFITERTLSEHTYLPVTSEFSVYPCISCDMVDDAIEPEVGILSVKPNSIFYPLKLWREDRGDRNFPNRERLMNLLGLSLKRLSEILSLKNTDDISHDGWLSAVIMLTSNWKEIGLIYSENYAASLDYSIQWRIYKYASYERRVLEFVRGKPYVSGETEFGKLLDGAIAELDSIGKKILVKISELPWQRTYVYDVTGFSGPLYIYPYSLPLDRLKKPLYPAQYVVNGTTYTMDQTNPKISVPITKSKNTLILKFDLPNLFFDEDIISDTKELRTKTCITSSIHEFSVTSSYVITAQLQNYIDGTVYITRDHEVMKTADYKPPEEKFFDADVEIPVSKNNTGQFQYKFSGSANDKGADVYFCTDSPINPRDLFSEITITEWVKPLLYSYTNPPKNSDSDVRISYVRVDPTTYVASVQNTVTPYIVSLGERFSQQWEARIDGAVLPKHFELNGFENGWLVDKSGSYDISITYSSQRLMIVGFVITGLTSGIISILMLVFILRRKRNEKIII